MMSFGKKTNKKKRTRKATSLLCANEDERREEIYHDENKLTKTHCIEESTFELVLSRSLSLQYFE